MNSPDKDKTQDLVVNPSLIVLYVNKENNRILFIDDETITFEAADEYEGIFEIELSIYDIEKGEYDSFYLDELKIISTRKLQFSIIYKLQFLGFSQVLLSIVVSRLSQITGENKKKKEAFNYSKNSNIPPGKSDNLESFKNHWWQFSATAPARQNEMFTSIADRLELSLVLNDVGLYGKFLSGSISSEALDIIRDLGLEKHGLFKKGFKRLYIGNEFCHHLFPDTGSLEGLLAKCKSENYNISVVFPYILESTLKQVKASIDVLDDFVQKNGINIEIVVNDWGLLKMIEEMGSPGSFTLTLGRLLNKAVKDPRIRNLWNYTKHRNWFRENNLNCPWSHDFLQSRGIHRFEYDYANIEIKLPSGHHSLHFPFYFMNVSVFCPLYIQVVKGNPCNQMLADRCNQLCLRHLYAHEFGTNYIGIGNTILCFSDALLKNSNLLGRLVGQGINRLVFTSMWTQVTQFRLSNANKQC